MPAILWSWQRQRRRGEVSRGRTANFMLAVKREMLKPQQSFWESSDARHHEKEMCIGSFCYFLPWPWQYLLCYLRFLPEECQMWEEVCTPGEFNLTMPLGGRKERKATTEKNTAKKQNLGGGGRVMKQTIWWNSCVTFSEITLHSSNSNN